MSETVDPLLGRPSGLKRRLVSIEAAAIAGIVCAAGWSLAIRGMLSTPGIGAPATEVVDYYADRSNATAALVWLQVLVFASIAFLWFVGVVRARVGDVEPKLFGTVFFGATILLAALLFVGTSLMAAPAVLVAVGDQPTWRTSLLRAAAGAVLSVFAPRIATLVLLSTASLGRATGALPRWLVWLTIVMGVVEFVNVSIATPTIYPHPGLGRRRQRRAARPRTGERLRHRRRRSEPVTAPVSGAGRPTAEGRPRTPTAASPPRARRRVPGASEHAAPQQHGLDGNLVAFTGCDGRATRSSRRTASTPGHSSTSLPSKRSTPPPRAKPAPSGSWCPHRPAHLDRRDSSASWRKRRRRVADIAGDQTLSGRTWVILTPTRLEQPGQPGRKPRCSTCTYSGPPGSSSTPMTSTSGRLTSSSQTRVGLVSTGAPRNRLA